MSKFKYFRNIAAIISFFLFDYSEICSAASKNAEKSKFSNKSIEQQCYLVTEKLGYPKKFKESCVVSETEAVKENSASNFANIKADKISEEFCEGVKFGVLKMYKSKQDADEKLLKEKINTPMDSADKLETVIVLKSIMYGVDLIYHKNYKVDEVVDKSLAECTRRWREIENVIDN